MANYVEIYFASSDDRDATFGKAASALGVLFEPSDKPYADFIGRLPGFVVDFKHGHPLENDAGIPFEEMPYVLTVRGLHRQAPEEERAAELFGRLESLGYRPMYLVRGLDEILLSRS